MAIIVDQYLDTSTGSVYIQYPNWNEACGQSFTGDGGTLNSIVFKMSKSGSPTGNLTVTIYAHTGTFGTSSKPTGAVLATSATVLDVSTLTTSPVDKTFTFTGGDKITLTNGTKYCVVSNYNDGNSSNRPGVHYDATSPTHGGNVFWTDTGGAPWTSQSGDDFYFIVYKDGVPAEGSNRLLRGHGI